MRLLICLPLLGIAMYCWAQSTSLGGPGGAGFRLVSIGCIGIIAIYLAFPLAQTFAEPVGGLFWPDQRNKRPLPIYGIAESKRVQGLYEEAFDAFEGIAEAYRDEIKPHIQMIEMAIIDLKDPERAEAVYRRGMARLRKQDARKVLTHMYETTLPRLHSRHTNTPVPVRLPPK